MAQATATSCKVKVEWTREEEFTWAYFRPAGVIDINSGARRDGTITAWECHNYNSGPAAINPPYSIAQVEARAFRPVKEAASRKGFGPGLIRQSFSSTLLSFVPILASIRLVNPSIGSDAGSESCFN